MGISPSWCKCFHCALWRKLPRTKDGLFLRCRWREGGGRGQAPRRVEVWHNRRGNVILYLCYARHCQCNDKGHILHSCSKRFLSYQLKAREKFMSSLNCAEGLLTEKPTILGTAVCIPSPHRGGLMVPIPTLYIVYSNKMRKRILWKGCFTIDQVTFKLLRP